MPSITELEYIKRGLAEISANKDLNKEGLQTYSKHLYKIMYKFLKELKDDKNTVS